MHEKLSSRTRQVHFLMKVHVEGNVGTNSVKDYELHNQEVVGSNPAGCWEFFSFYCILMRILKQVPRGGATFPISHPSLAVKYEQQGPQTKSNQGLRKRILRIPFFMEKFTYLFFSVTVSP